ncbi:MAG: sulfatase, partial [bacterium]
GKVEELLEDGRIDLYDGEIRYLDSLIGDLLSTLNECQISDDTVVILTADHGEQLGQHGCYGHGGVHEAVTFVPIIVWGPKFVPSGKVIDGFVQQIDIAPTILELIGVEELPPLDGESLLPIIRGEKKARTSIILEDEEQRAYLDGKWKYIKDYYVQKEALYQIEDDPCEVVNLIDREKEIAQRMRASLDEWVQKNLKGRSDPLPEAAERWRRIWKEFLGREFPKNATPTP